MRNTLLAFKLKSVRWDFCRSKSEYLRGTEGEKYLTLYIR